MSLVDPPPRLRDPARLAALRRLAIHSISANEELDRVARLAARAVSAPAALVTLADESHRHLGAGADPLVLTDAREHPELHERLAIPDVDVVAYLGASLVTEEGLTLGALCVVDHVPRVWTADEVATVQEFAATATTLLELAAANALGRWILESIGDAFLALDEDSSFVYVNPAAERLLERTNDELAGRNAWLEFPDVVGTPFEHETKRAIREERPIEYEAWYEPADVCFSVRAYPARNGGVSVYFRNVTRRKRLEEELEVSREEAIHRLARAIALRSAETGAHVERIATYSSLLAGHLGLDERERELIRIASQLHDVGKIGIPDRVLLAPRPLGRAERAVMERHAELGHQMLAGSGQELLELAATVALTHHERPDGSGYPRGLRRDAIPLASRIVAVADVFDALTSARVYRQAVPLGRSLEIMRAGRGTQLDGEVLDCLLGALDEVLEVRAAHVDDPAAASSS